jgi:hypothetical protein
MDDVLHAEPSRRGGVAILVAVVLVLGAAALRVRARDSEARPAPSPSPSGTAPSSRARADLVDLMPGYSSSHSPGEYTIQVTLRAAAPLTLFAVVPLAADGTAVPAKAATFFPEDTKGWRVGEEPPPAPPPLTPGPPRRQVLLADGHIDAIVLVEPDCLAPVAVVALRVTYVAEDATREQVLTLRAGEPDSAALVAGACET